MYRAERLDGKGKVDGYYFINPKTGSHLIKLMGNEKDEELWIYENLAIKIETLEIYLFGEWRLVSELDKKYKLVEV